MLKCRQSKYINKNLRKGTNNQTKMDNINIDEIYQNSI